MAPIAIHPGEHLAEETERTRHERPRAGAQIGCPDEPHHRHLERAAGHHWRHRTASFAFLRHERGILAESAKPL